MIKRALRQEELVKQCFSLLTHGWKRDGEAVDCDRHSFLQLLAWAQDCMAGRATEAPGLLVVRECSTTG